MIFSLNTYSCSYQTMGSILLGFTFLHFGLGLNAHAGATNSKAVSSDKYQAMTEGVSNKKIFSIIQSRNAAKLSQYLRQDMSSAYLNQVKKGDGQTPLMLAAQMGAADMVQVLIDAGADINYDHEGRNVTALEVAAAQRQKNIVNIFLPMNVNIAKWSKDRIAHFQINLIQLNDEVLLNQYFKLYGKEYINYLPETGGRAGLSALTFAVQINSLPLVRTVLEAGADIQVQTPQNLTIFDYCPIQSHEIFRFLISAKPDLSKLENAKIAEIFIRLVKTGDVEAARIFIQENGNAYVNGRDRLGYTPLIAASQEGHVPMVKFLLEEGADIHATSINGHKQTAMQIAFNYQKHNVVQVLSEHEASLNSKAHAVAQEK